MLWTRSRRKTLARRIKRMLSVSCSNNWRRSWPSQKEEHSVLPGAGHSSKLPSDVTTVIGLGTSNENVQSLSPRTRCAIHRIGEEGKDKPGNFPEGINSNGILVQLGPDHSRDTHRMLWKMRNMRRRSQRKNTWSEKSHPRLRETASGEVSERVPPPMLNGLF